MREIVSPKMTSFRVGDNKTKSFKVPHELPCDTDAVMAQARTDNGLVLHGNIAGVDKTYVYLEFGTPPDRDSVIVTVCG